MADSIGAVQVPLQTPSFNEAVGDPCLSRLTAYLQAVSNKYLVDAWNTVAPNTLPAQFAFAHNPEDIVFLERQTPALYLYRHHEDPFEWLAEDYDIAKWWLRLIWVFPPARQEFQRQRSSFVNSLSAHLKHFIELGRDPSYVAPGETDVPSLTLGTVIYKATSVWGIDWKGCKTYPGMPIKIDKDTRHYFTLDAQIFIEERRQLDIVADFPTSQRTGTEPNTTGGLDLTLTNPDGTLVLNQAKV